MHGHREFPGASYDNWKTTPPDWEQEEEECCICGNISWDIVWRGDVRVVECCGLCCVACPDIEDLYERCDA